LKLTKKQKEQHKKYLRKVKLVNELHDLQFSKITTLKCSKCKNKIEIKKLLDCRNKFLSAMNSNRKIGTSDSEFPFGIVQGIFVSSPPLVLCKGCQYDVYRFMGKIPDLHDPTVFPQRSTKAEDIDKFFDNLKSKKPTKYELHYKNKKYTNTPKKYDALVIQSVKRYIKKYPYIKYTQKQLVGIIKSYKRQDGVSLL